MCVWKGKIQNWLLSHVYLFYSSGAIQKLRHLILGGDGVQPMPTPYNVKRSIRGSLFMLSRGGKGQKYLDSCWRIVVEFIKYCACSYYIFRIFFSDKPIFFLFFSFLFFFSISPELQCSKISLQFLLRSKTFFENFFWILCYQLQNI